MFTGIVQEVGRVVAIRDQGDQGLRIACQRDAGSIALGASISCNGVCLTVVETGRFETPQHGLPSWFDVLASAETRACTTLGTWALGDPVNLEPALRLGDELGGHIVSGHVDGVGHVVSVEPEGASHRVVIEAPAGLGRYIAAKGSIAVDGVSLTVNSVEGSRFGVNIIPHTWALTGLGAATPGRAVNIEIDLLFRYVARLTQVG